MGVNFRQWVPGFLLGSFVFTLPGSVFAQAELDSIEEESNRSALTSVSQLQDVSPSSWAFTALQSLVERYGCIAGYPDATFQGDRPLGRYELVAALDACLDSIGRDALTQEDLETVKAIQSEMIATLTQTQSKIDGLEARTDTLEAQQFSTTTKLQGEVVSAVQFGATLDNLENPAVRLVVPEAGPAANSNLDQPRLTNLNAVNRIRASAISRVRLTFNSSFSGSDLLSTTLETGNSGSDFFGEGIGLAGSANPFPVPSGIATNNRPPLVDLGAVAYGNVGTDVSLYRLAYTFKPTQDLSLTFGTNLYPSDFIDFNSYANDESSDFNSGFFINNPLIVTNTVESPGGAGAAIDWNIGSGPVSLRGLYLASSATTPVAPDNGLFSSPYQGSVEFEYADSFGGNDQNNFAARLQYTNSRARNDIVIQHVVGANAEVTLGKLGLFGRYGISFDPFRSDEPGLAGDLDRDLFSLVPGFGDNRNIRTWMAGAAYKDLFREGSLLGLAVGQPFLLGSSQNERYSPQTNYEIFYRFPVSDNLTLTPALMLITDPFNIENAPDEFENTIFQGVIRATFRF